MKIGGLGGARMHHIIHCSYYIPGGRILVGVFGGGGRDGGRGVNICVLMAFDSNFICVVALGHCKLCEVPCSM